MTFGVDGQVKEGAGFAEQFWRFDGQSLVLIGRDGVTCRLEPAGPSHWAGIGLLNEHLPVELISEIESIQVAVRKLPSPTASATAKKRLVYSTNAAYFDMLCVSIASFLRHNDSNEWSISVLDVGLLDWQREALQTVGIDLPIYEANRTVNCVGIIYPAGLSRLKMLEDFTGGSGILLYLDADSLVLGSIEPMLNEFIASGQAIGLATEFGNCEWTPPRMRDAFAPAARTAFSTCERWQDHLVMNTGVVLARGEGAAEIGRRCTDLYPSISRGSIWAEQSILDAVLLEHGYSWWEIPQHHHCMVRADLIDHAAPIYEGGATYQGQKVTVRHFCGWTQKHNYVQDILPKAREFFGI